MFRRLVGKITRGIKLLFISSVLIFIILLSSKNLISEASGSNFDLNCALIISLGFAISFRVMLCCRKKV